ncbi:MAG: hypothetical protein AAF726_14575 [Planctomycetota bacterium]
MAFASCASQDILEERPWRRALPPPTAASTHVVQGFVGITEFTTADTRTGSPGIEILDSGIETFPMLGGAFQRALWNGPIQFGLEGGLSFGWDSNATLLSTSTGAIVTESENDVFLLDGFAGVYANLPLRAGIRLYAGAGPVLQYGAVSATFLSPGSSPEPVEEDGFGGGWYARTGVDIVVSPGTMLGFGIRWIDTYVDLGPTLRDLQLEGMQFGFTVSQGF